MGVGLEGVGAAAVGAAVVGAVAAGVGVGAAVVVLGAPPAGGVRSRESRCASSVIVSSVLGFSPGSVVASVLLSMFVAVGWDAMVIYLSLFLFFPLYSLMLFLPRLPSLFPSTRLGFSALCYSPRCGVMIRYSAV